MHLLIDGKNFVYRGLHNGHKPIQNVDGKEISLIQFVLLEIRKLLTSVEDLEDITFCWDSNGSKKRKEIHPLYKENRNNKSNDEELTKKLLLDQIEALKECLPLFGIKQLCIPDIEADDIICILSKTLNFINKECTIVSADKDLLQLINPLTKIMNLNKKKTIRVSNFEEIVQVPLESYVDYLALIGDTVDNIDGIRDVGPETARRILKLYNNCENFFSKEKEIRSMITLGQFDNAFSRRVVSIFSDYNKAKFERNKKLITLDGFLTREEAINVITKYQEQSTVSLNEEKVSEYVKKMHLFDINQNLGVFLVPFKYIKNNIKQ